MFQLGGGGQIYFSSNQDLGCLLAVSWQSLNFLSAVSQMSFSCLSAVFQLSLSCLSAVYQLSISCLPRENTLTPQNFPYVHCVVVVVCTGRLVTGYRTILIIFGCAKTCNILRQQATVEMLRTM